MTTARISLDSPVFSGRLRTFARRSTYERREVRAGRSGLVSDIRPTAVVKAAPQQRLVQGAKMISRKPVAAPVVHPRTDRSHVLKRKAVQVPGSQAGYVSEKPAHRPLQKKLLTALAVLLFVVGIGVALDGFLTNRHVEAQVEQQGTNNNSNVEAPMVGDIPAEGDTPDVSAHRVAATLPRKITIPKLSAEARVLKLGTTASGAFAAPASIYDTGWYQDSAKPGEPGAMLIDGHVHGPTKPGVFHELKTLKSGDEITIERGDGKVFTYKVVKTKTYPADSVDMMGAALTPVTAGKPGLNLITCTGELDSSNHYKDRLVVFAEQQ